MSEALTSAQEARRVALLNEALALPEQPGVYIMHDAADKIIYVGKSRHLRDRVSQYFRLGEKNAKTERMVRSVHRFECIHCDTEMEALTLENTLIKQHNPRYNIRLKDAKSYPFIKLTSGEYPRFIMSRKRESDGRYFGPYSGTAIVYSTIDFVNKALGLPSCKHRFPRDIGRVRPCIYYQIGQCRGVCTGKIDIDEYNEAVASACEVLKGNTASVRRALEEKMIEYAENEQYELAAKCRDTAAALSKLSQRQKAVASPDTDQDAIGFYTDEVCSALSLLRIRKGMLIDKIDFTMGAEVIADTQALISLLYEHYKTSQDVPPKLLIGFNAPEEDAELLSSLLTEMNEKKKRVSVIIPQKGDNKKLCAMASENAHQAALKYHRDSEKGDGAALRLAELLSLEVVPDRIESYDVSNLGDEHITVGMIVLEGGKFQKSDYRTFKITSTQGADDYGSLREALRRRFAHLSDTEGGFAKVPDLVLLDGGAGQLSTALEVAEEMGVDIPFAGMVKDDYHKTRALVTSAGEVDISREREVYVFLYKIQEEVHRFTVSKMSAAKRKTIKRSSLEKIHGIGATKAKKLLSAFGTLSALKSASVDEIASIKGISASDAKNVVQYFKEMKGR